MIFPGTRFEVDLSRVPWVCTSVVTLSVVVFLLMPPRSEPLATSPEAAQAEAFAYWQSHGYLDVAPQVLQAANRRFEARVRPIAIAAIRELGQRAMPEDEAARSVERNRLDDLTLAAQAGPDSVNPLPSNHPLRRFGFVPAAPKTASLFAHGFLYAGWFHLFVVCGMLLGLGAAAERRWGPRAFAAFYFSSLVGSCAAHVWLEPTSKMSWIGASGPVAGLMAVHLLRHRFDPIHVEAPTFRSGRFGWKTIELPWPALPAAWLLLNFTLAVWLEETGVRNDLSISALAGGFGVGLLAMPILRGLAIEPPYLGHGQPLEAAVRSDAVQSRLDEAFVARDMGDVDRAFELLRTQAQQNPEDIEVTRAYWQVAVSTGQSEAVAGALTDQIQRQIRKDDLHAAASLWRSLVEQLPDHRLPAALVLRLVPTLLEAHPVEFALAALRQCVHAPRGELSIGLALQILDVAEELDPYSALMAARRALELPELHEGKRARILARVVELDPDGPEARASQPAPQRDETRVPQPSASVFVEPDAVDPDAVEPDAIEEVAAPSPPDIAIGHEADEPQPPMDLANLPRFDGIQAVAAVPTGLEKDVLYFRLENGRKAKVAYRDVQALAVAALRDIASKPVVVIDLLLNWSELSDAPLRTIRLRSDQFDPARIVAAVGSPIENLQAFLAQLQARTQALPLPDAQAVAGQPFRVFKFMRSYQRRVLKVDC